MRARTVPRKVRGTLARRGVPDPSCTKQGGLGGAPPLLTPPAPGLGRARVSDQRNKRTGSANGGDDTREGQPSQEISDSIETPQKFRVIVTGLAHIHFCLRRSSAAPRSGCTLSHWISSSARASIEGGIVNPSALYSSGQSPDQETEWRRKKRGRGGRTWRPGACRPEDRRVRMPRRLTRRVSGWQQDGPRGSRESRPSEGQY
jgi:hypothetical protein